MSAFLVLLAACGARSAETRDRSMIVAGFIAGPDRLKSAYRRG